ncbi:hypothetical protein PMIN06_002197 [Paraphaeosphaeria minitans]
MSASIVAFHPEKENDAWAEKLLKKVAGVAEDWEAARPSIRNMIWIPAYLHAADEKCLNSLRRKWSLTGKTAVREGHAAMPGQKVALPVRIAWLEDITKF